MNDIEQRIKDDNVDFMEKVWTVIKEDYPGAYYLPAEATGESVAKELDFKAGIDGFIVGDDYMISVANRLLRMDFHTFTIRATKTNSHTTHDNTELKKRLDAVHSGGLKLYPNITIQSYVVDGEFKRASIIKTEDLYRLIRKWDAFEFPKTFGSTWWFNNTGNASFLCIHFRFLKANYPDLKLYGVDYDY